MLLPVAVSRIKARSDMYEMDLVLDINVDIYPVMLLLLLLLVLLAALVLLPPRFIYYDMCCCLYVGVVLGAACYVWCPLPCCRRCHTCPHCGHACAARAALALPTLRLCLPLQVSVGDKLVLCLASTLNLDGTAGSTSYDAVGSCRPAAGCPRGAGWAARLILQQPGGCVSAAVGEPARKPR